MSCTSGVVVSGYRQKRTDQKEMEALVEEAVLSDVLKYASISTLPRQAHQARGQEQVLDRFELPSAYWSSGVEGCEQGRSWRWMPEASPNRRPSPVAEKAQHELDNTVPLNQVDAIRWPPTNLRSGACQIFENREKRRARG